jgi:hypothetical protein
MKRTLLALILLVTLILPTPARADGGILYGQTIPPGTTVDHDVLLIGQNVSIDGTVNGNAFILGNQVLIRGKVNGSLVMIAQNAAIEGQVDGAVYAAALTLDLPDAAVLSRDLYALTVSLTSKPASSIGRHLFALGLDAGLNGRVGGDLHTAIGPIQLYNGLMRLLGFDELTIELHFEVPSGAPAPQPPSGSLGVPPKAHLRLKLQNPLPAFNWSAWAIDVLRNWGVLFVLGLLVLWLARRSLGTSGLPLRAHPWRTLGLGILVLVVSLNLFVVALLLAALIFALGLGLNVLGLWQLSLALWVLAYSALASALTLLSLFILYGTKILVAFNVFSWLAGKLSAPRVMCIDILALLVGTLIYALLRSLPYVGWAIGLLVIAAGMGSAWFAWRGATLPPQVVAVPPPVKPTRRSS